MKKYFSLLLCVLFLAGCGQVGAVTAPTSVSQPLQEETVRYRIPEGDDSLENRIYYEVFVRSYCDGDGDGLGDLKGLTQKLPYLEELGVGGIWLMPIHPSPSYHKYDVLDYYAIDPEYGTMADFEEFLTQCHSRDMKVMLDLVLNHTSSDHPWFQEACRYLSHLPQKAEPDDHACPAVEFYHFSREPAGGYHPVPEAEGWYYEGRFTDRMPDLNFDSPALLSELRSIMDFWLKKGVDGFRLDAAKEYESGKTDRNIEILRWVSETAREINPDVVLVGEVWDSFQQIGRYYESGLPSIFNYPFGGSGGKIVKVLRNAGNPAMVSSYAEALQKADSCYRSKNPDYVDAPFLSNHDVGRIAGFVGRNPEKTKLAGAMNLFMTGNVFIYYGEEIGMVAGAIDDPSYRGPMLWQQEGGKIQPPPGCTLPDQYPFGFLQQQRGQPDSIYEYYRAAAAVRNRIPALAEGIPQVEVPLNQGCVSAVRKTAGSQSCIVLMNIDEKPVQLSLADYADWDFSAALAVGETPVTLENGVLNLPAFGTAVLTKNGE